MGYVAAKGGTEAVLHAEQLLEYFRLKGESEPITGVPMRAIRRISATFKDIPGGQLLGPTRDYQLKLLNTVLANESDQSMHDFLDRFEESIDEKASDGQAGIFPKVTENMRAQGILAEPPSVEQAEALAEPYDVTRKALSFPAPRSARLQLLAQGDVGGLQMFAYSSVRGYGDVHPTLGELRLGYIPVEVAHPLTNEPVEIGEILATECEMVSGVYAEGEQNGEEPSLPKFGLGYGFSFGHNEVKVMSMSIIARVISAAKENGVHGQGGPAADEEFVLLHIDGIESSGFTAHYKLPHYVSFQSDISVLERARDYRAARSAEGAEAKQSATERDVLKVIDQGDDDSVNAVNLRRFIQKTTGIVSTTNTTEATIIQTRHRIPEEPMRDDQILVLQVPMVDPLRWVEPVIEKATEVHAEADYGLMWVYMYESVIESGDMNVAAQYPVMVEKRYMMDTTPIPRYDVPRLHMAETLYLFGAGREKRVYAVPPYTNVVPLAFEDYPFSTEHNPEQFCEKCGANDTYLTGHYVQNPTPGAEGHWAYHCSDTSYCNQRAQVKIGKEL